MIQWLLAIWSLVPLLFLNPVWTSGKFTVHIQLKPGLVNFEHYFTSVWDECNHAVFWMFFTLPFFGIGMKTDLFQSCGHCWVFQICWHIECSSFTALSFRIWKSSTGIPSPPLALLEVMLPKAHWTSYSRMSGSRWVITPLWLSGSWRSLLYSSSVYSCHLFLISSASVRFLPFQSFIVLTFAWNPAYHFELILKQIVQMLFSFYRWENKLRKNIYSLLRISQLAKSNIVTVIQVCSTLSPGF